MTRPAQQVLNKSEFPFLLLPVMVPSLSLALPPRGPLEAREASFSPRGAQNRAADQALCSLCPCVSERVSPGPFLDSELGQLLGVWALQPQGDRPPHVLTVDAGGWEGSGLQLCLGAAWGPFPAPWPEDHHHYARHHPSSPVTTLGLVQ